jgi:hypothetical protein
MKSIFALLRSPSHERIEAAVKTVAERASDVQFHRHMSDYFYEERTNITPQVSAAAASEYARLYHRQEDHQAEALIAERKHSEAKARLNALRKS